MEMVQSTRKPNTGGSGAEASPADAGGNAASASLVTVDKLLRCADDIEAERPRVAYLCRLRALYEAVRLHGRGHIQFKTELFNRVRNEEQPTREARREITDQEELTVFFLEYADRANRRWRSGEKSDREEMSAMFTNAYIVFEVLRRHVDEVLRKQSEDPSSSSSSKPLTEEVFRMGAETERKARELSRKVYNMVPLDVQPPGLLDRSVSRSEHFSSTAAPVARVLDDSMLPEVQAAVEALQGASRLPPPPGIQHQFTPTCDVFDWLQVMFGFQRSNASNQREHLVLLLAMGQSRQVAPIHEHAARLRHLDDKVVRWVWDKTLANYKYWCSSLDIEPVTELAIKALSASQGPQEVKYRLVFVCLYLLVWGEAANLRFLPECLCYIFHRMAHDTHDVLERKVDPKTGSLRRPAIGGPEFTFLEQVVKPVYTMVRKEHGNATVRDKENVVSVLSPSLWKNYDDINEYFWTNRCMVLGWPWHGQKDFFQTTESLRSKVQAQDSVLAMDIEGASGIGAYSSMRRHDKKDSRGCCSCLLARWFRSAKARLATPTAKTALERRSFFMVLRAFPSYLGFIIITLIAMILFAFRNPDRQSHDVNLNLVFPEFMAELVEAGFRAANATTFERVEPDSDEGGLLPTRINWDDFFMRSHFWRSTGVCVCAYALLHTLQAILEVHASLRILIRMARLKALKLLLQVLLHGCWSAAFVFAYYRMMEECCVDKYGNRIPQPTEYDYTFLEMVGLYVLPDVLRFVLTGWPRLQRWAKQSNLSAVKLVRWWFTSEAYVGREMIERTHHKLFYVLFWLVLAGCKLLFSYFFQVKPLVNVSRNMWRDCSVQYNWFEFAPGCVNFGVTIFHLWVPTVPVYIIDMGIWYSIFSTLLGAFSGGRARQGEIRNMTMLRARFETFPRAFSNKFMPTDEGPTANRGRISDMSAHRSPPPRGAMSLLPSIMDSHRSSGANSTQPLVRREEVEFAERFSVLWNEFIECMREEDLISNKERDMLKMPRACEEVPVVQWPIFLLAGKVQGAVDIAVGWGSSTRTEHMWGAMKKNAYTRYAVQEAYYLFKAILAELVVGEEETSAVNRVFNEIEKDLEENTFGRKFVPKALPMVLERVLTLLRSLVTPDISSARGQIVRNLQDLYDCVLYDFMGPTLRLSMASRHRVASTGERSVAALTAAALQHVVELHDDDDEGSDGPAMAAGNQALLFAPLTGKPVVVFPVKEKRPAFLAKASRLFSLLTLNSVADSELRSAEARRRLLFFGNSLFMKMPPAPFARSMRSFSTLVCCNQGDVVIYSHGDLVRKNAAGMSLLDYLRVIYKDQFENFLERHSITPSEAWKHNDAMELRLWASYRGQTAARSVRGAMYHQRAVQLAAFVDSAPIDILRTGFARRPNMGSELQDVAAYSLNLSLVKFTCVLSCPGYGKMKQSTDARAMDLLELLKRHEGLRLAYVDELELDMAPKTGSLASSLESATDVESGHSSDVPHSAHDSVLCKWHSGHEEEVYRIRLPGPAALGEERPEYENVAVVFTRGTALQVVDVRHDNCLEEAYKMRNLLEGFDEKAKCNTSSELRPPAIQGLGQSMVTDQVTSISEFAAIEEGTRASIEQRTMAYPLRVRMHYGRADVFDRLWILTRGGVNKPSLLLNHSPGVFAGFNAVLRGGRITHNEYIQTLHVCGNYGMGDVWQDQSIKAIGAGMQARSRDVARLGRQFDVFREMSFYHTHVGTYIIDTVVVISVYLYLFGKLYVALGGISEDLLRHSLVVEAVANGIWMWWAGFLPLLPYFMEMGLQKGFKVALLEVGVYVFQLAPMYFAINMGTRLHYFYLTMVHGVTSKQVEWQSKRSFGMQHVTFVDNFRMFSRSHFIRAFELLMLLTVYVIFGKYDLGDFGIVTFAIWFLVFTWLMGPFILNPGGLEWRMITTNFDDFLTWIFKRGGPGVSPASSWESWWEEEQAPLNSTGFLGRLVEMAFQLRFFVFQYGIAYTLSFSRASLTMYAASWVFVAFLVFVLGLSSITINYYNQGESRLYRLTQAILFVAIIGTFSTLLATDVIEWQDIGGTLIMLVSTFWGLLQLGIAARPCCEFLRLWSIVKFFAKQFDLGIATLLMLPISFLSWFPFLAEFQMRLLCTQRGSESEVFTRMGARKANSDEE
eukprot:jgi/Mesvir1/3237/Mv16380-RA.1